MLSLVLCSYFIPKTSLLGMLWGEREEGDEVPGQNAFSLHTGILEAGVAKEDGSCGDVTLALP